MYEMTHWSIILNGPYIPVILPLLLSFVGVNSYCFGLVASEQLLMKMSLSELNGPGATTIRKGERAPMACRGIQPKTKNERSEYTPHGTPRKDQ